MWRQVAVKVPQKASDTAVEAKFLKACTSEHVVKLMSTTTTSLVLELLCPIQIPAKKAALMLHQLLLALKYIHEQQICHRDVKIDNLMLSKEGTLKLSDFGCSSYFRAEPLHRQEGNLRYWPPQLHDMPASGYYPQGADTWVAGICGHEFVRGLTFQEMVSNIMQGPDFADPDLSLEGLKVRGVVQQLLAVDPHCGLPACLAAAQLSWCQWDLLCGKRRRLNLSRKVGGSAVAMRKIDHIDPKPPPPEPTPPKHPSTQSFGI